MGDGAEESARRLAEQHGLRFVDLTQSAIAPGAATLLPENVARRHRAVPIGRRLGTPVIAVSDPGDLFAMDSLRTSVGREFVAVVAIPEQVDRAIGQLYSTSEHAGEDEDSAGADEGATESSNETADGAEGDLGSADLGGSTPGDAGVSPEVEAEVEHVASAVAVDDSLEAEASSLDLEELKTEIGGTLSPDDLAEMDGSLTLGDTPAPEDEGAGAGNDAVLDAGIPGEADAGAMELGALELEADADAAVGNGNGHSANGRAKGNRGRSRKGGADVEEAEEAESDGVLAASEAVAGGSDDGALADVGEEALPEYAQAVGGEDTAGADAAAEDGFLTEEDPGVLAAAPATSLEESLREILAPPPRPEWPQPGVEPQDQEAYASLGGDAAAASGDQSGAAFDGDVPPAPEGYGVVDAASALPASIAFGPPLARVLVESGRVTVEEMENALREHQATGESLARYLYNRHMATEEDLVRAMAQEVGLEFVDLDKISVDTSAAGLIPESVARHHMVLPIKIERGVPLVAMANPTDVFAMDDLRTIMGRNFTPVVATRSQIAHHLRQFQNVGADVEGVALDAASDMTTGASAGFELESLQAVVEDAPIVRYVNLLILQALNERASDIHIEPTPKRLRIRFRIDGVMHDATSASSSIHQAVVSRLKVLGEMDITEHRVPQEGRVSLSVSDRQIDLRLATLPSMFGETCVMRLLDKSASIRSLPDLGFLPDTLEQYATAYRHPYGVILVTGPTGAGKTTTLYATLAEVMTSDKSVVTVEDPV